MKKRHSFPVPQTPIYCLLVMLVTINGLAPGRQASSIQWSTPNPISGISLESNPPILVADQNRTVHAFSSQWMDESTDAPVRAIVYSQWTLEYGWTSPVDVLVSPVGEARVTDAYLDHNGIIHLIFFGGNAISGDIYYTQSPAASADNATSWSTPIIVGEDAADPESAAIVGDGQDRLAVIYHGRQDGHGVYVVTSPDGGSTWSNPTPIFLADGDAPYVFGIQAITNQSGSIHVIWNTFSQEGQGRGIYYARSAFGDSSWSDPVALVAVKAGLGTQTPTIIEHDNVLYALYNLTPKISMRRSIDNGLTWDDPTILFPRHVGVNGSLSMVIDGNDTMHLFFGQRITGTQGNPDIHGMWHSTWLSGRWTEPDAVIKGPRIVDTEGTNSFDPYEAHAIVSQGNVILVTWRTDPGAKGDIKANGIWFSYAKLNAPESPIATLQAPSVPSLSEKATPTISAATQTAQIDPTPVIAIDRNRPGQNPVVGAVIGLMVVGFLWILYSLFTRR